MPDGARNGPRGNIAFRAQLVAGRVDRLVDGHAAEGRFWFAGPGTGVSGRKGCGRRTSREVRP